MDVDDGGGSGGSVAAEVVEAGGGGGGASEPDKKKSVPEGEPKVKRKMKTAAELEILEKAYTVETYPSEALRAELAVKLGLSDRQLQMWFCHRRLKDRKGPAEKRAKKEASPGMAPGLSSGAGGEMMVGHGAEQGNDHGMTLGRNTIRPKEIHHRRVAHRTGTALARIGPELPTVKRFYEPPQALSELRAIAFVEAQLGERLREDGPVLGMEFDPLPPGAFGSPLVASGPQKPSVRLYETQVFESPDAKVIQGGKRTIHEYQFLPEQPSLRDDIRERDVSIHQYGSPIDAQNSVTPLPAMRSSMHGSEQLHPAYGFQGKLSSLNLAPQLGSQGHQIYPPSGQIDNVPPKNTFVDTDTDAHVSHPIMGPETSFLPSYRRGIHDEEQRIERKRKIEEARIAKEVEAHEKRIRKELEKQDLLRRKREEQMRKEMERQDKERRKEEERLMREKLREEERYQREQRREMERREKFLQKESIKAEKMRLKEEMRREKEAARLRAAQFRAKARRIAKESIELLDDEHLELMELAASSRGLPSVSALDSEALQNLASFEDALTDFPPKTVNLKRPFGVQPWVDSEMKVGNVLMVWRFLTTFSDVLGLWPFTLDEFVQGLHDYEPRLLGEIHIALMRNIIKDVEDVAKIPAPAVGANQTSNPGGGHPHIVEGAYAWGFDIRSWKLHLNPLTWPEILRQLALAAGFGPKLTNCERANLHDENEGNDGVDIISDLRTGAAAENAVAKMRQRGISNLRRSGHRLTPGTVKYAAFHILSLEGSKGITIMEAAEKIQKSGLRDLTTSKTPEASIAAALSRDTKLFERTAPSTYCVRAPFRKDPADAEAILAAARDKIQAYKNEFLETEEPDDADRYEESESDAPDDPDVDDLDNELKLDEDAPHSWEPSSCEGMHSSADRKELHNDFMKVTPTNCASPDRSLNVVDQSEELKLKGAGASADQSAAVIAVAESHVAVSNQEEIVIDESYLGEIWVLGLTEGDYCDLSVEERLDALVALVGIANEGNSIRVVLEERLEAANTLKKQMWADAQLDKRRFREHYALKVHYPLLPGNRSENNISSLAESADPANHLENLGDPERIPNYSDNTPADRNVAFPELPGADLIPQSIYAAEKSRSEIKAYISQRAEEIYVYKSLPLGQDRRRNRYWQFIASSSRSDPGTGRIFVELHDGRWRIIDSAEDFDALLASLDVRGIRESHLHSMLRRVETSFRETAGRNSCLFLKRQDGGDLKIEGEESPKSMISGLDLEATAAITAIKLRSSELEKIESLKRYKDFEKWIWEECFNSMKWRALMYEAAKRKQLLNICTRCHDLYFPEDQHCSFCHTNYSISCKNSSFEEHVSKCQEKYEAEISSNLAKMESSPTLRIRLLKAQLAFLEAALLPEALEAFWTEDYRISWCRKLQGASTSEDILQNLTLLESAVKRDFIASDFETTSELLGYSTMRHPVGGIPVLDVTAVLPWIPQTSSAVALRLMEFDNSIFYSLKQKEDFEKEKGSKHVITIPPRSIATRNSSETPFKDPPHDTNVPKDNWDGPGTERSSSGCRAGNISIYVGRPQRSVSEAKSRPGQGITATNVDKFAGLPRWKGRTRGRGGRKGGRRTVKTRLKSGKKASGTAGRRDIASPGIYEESPSLYDKQEWSAEAATPILADEAGNLSSSEKSESDDENGQTAGDDYDDAAIDDYSGGLLGKSTPSMEALDFAAGEDNEKDDVDEEDEDYVDEEEDGRGNNRQREDAMEGSFSSDSEGGNHRFGGRDQMDGQYKGLEFSSSEYSD
ncbi:OLC1v1023873C1 [Oldenlandia corymbosa var. corymbosa]|uniref:OLC1v1023873C1 n=1 Tax=Oldenlandia corymbosa var. corymbosa TaxID=529605 RepID=A0AAV1C1G8_OLDCO|nr:OLC1v1023873C1 [Oldenlandia corymbosa var. corymbosa]